jgi:hypothetical protein
MVNPYRRPLWAAGDAPDLVLPSGSSRGKIVIGCIGCMSCRSRATVSEHPAILPLNFDDAEAQRFARVTICVGLTKRSAISSQIKVVTI